MSEYSISQTLQHARFIVGLTQEEAGQLVGVSRRAWAHWEDGTRTMPMAAFELFMAKITGKVPSLLSEESSRELIVVMGDDLVSPIDVVSSENFLSLVSDNQSGRFVISSLAIDRFTGKKYKHSVAFSANGNDHVLKAARKWKARMA